MRREDKEILDRGLIDKIIEEAEVCRLGLSKNNVPYIVPVAFGYDGRYIYFHTAVEGQKIDFMTSNNQICFELEHCVKLVPNDDAACKWTFSYCSVIGFGTVKEIVDEDGKAHALAQIMGHYSRRDDWEFVFHKLRLWQIYIERMTGKQSRDKTVV